MNKCKGCEWYNKPYWSIINPCENCPREETNVETITRWVDPTIEEKDKEIERLNKGLKLLLKQNREKQKIIYNAIEYIKEMPNNEYIGYWKKEIIDILRGVEKE